MKVSHLYIYIYIICIHIHTYNYRLDSIHQLASEIITLETSEPIPFSSIRSIKKNRTVSRVLINWGRHLCLLIRGVQPIFKLPELSGSVGVH